MTLCSSHACTTLARPRQAHVEGTHGQPDGSLNGRVDAAPSIPRWRNLLLHARATAELSFRAAADCESVRSVNNALDVDVARNVIAERSSSALALKVGHARADSRSSRWQIQMRPELRSMPVLVDRPDVSITPLAAMELDSPMCQHGGSAGSRSDATVSWPKPVDSADVPDRVAVLIEARRGAANCMGLRIIAEMALLGLEVHAFQAAAGQGLSLENHLTALLAEEMKDLVAESGGLVRPAAVIDSAVKAVRWCSSLHEAVSRVPLIIDAIPDEFGRKQQVVCDALMAMDADALLASHCLVSSLADLRASASARSLGRDIPLTAEHLQRIFCLRFLWPVVHMPYVESAIEPLDESGPHWKNICRMFRAMGKVIFDCPVDAHSRGASCEALALERLTIDCADSKDARRREMRRRWVSQENHQTGEETCVVCLNDRGRMLSVNCGHTALCVTCSAKYVSRSSTCPLCRRELHRSHPFVFVP